MMVPNYHNSSNSYASNSSSLVEKIEDQPYHIFNLTTHEASFSLCSRTIIRNSDQDQTPYHYREQLQLQDQEKVDESHSTIEKGDGARTTSIWKKEDGAKNQIEHGSSAKWMSSKMRMMRKMSTSSQQPSYKPMQQKLQDHKLLLSSSLETDNSSSSSNNNSPYNNNNNNTIIRVCSDCNTTKTPLWRSGPKGPKSLCNACGIRQRKARKALAAAAEAKTETNGAFKAVIKNNKVQHKEKGSSAESFLKPFKKRFKVKTPLSAGEENNKIDFEDLTMSLSQQYSALQQVFPQDEREGAILLMALSHGLVHG